MSDRKAILKVMYEVRITSIFRFSNTVALFCVFFNTTVFDDIHGAAFEPFFARLSG
jgi:hypothetical protein